MADQNDTKKNQPDRNLAANERPVPSQAEGDLETVEEDLEEKEQEQKERGAGKGQRK